MISYHTLDLLWYKSFILYLWSKYILLKKRWILKCFQFLFLVMSRSTDRSTVDKTKLLGRTLTEQNCFVGRSSCRPIMHKILECFGVHFDRPTGDTFSLGWVTVDQSVDRWRAKLSVWVTQPTRRSTANPNDWKSDQVGGRPTEEFSEDFPNGYFSGLSFLGHIPTDILGFLYLFSCPIYGGTVEKLHSKFLTPNNKF